MIHSLLATQFIIFTAYIIAIVRRYGVLPTISTSYYLFPETHNSLFTFFLWAMGIPLTVYGSVWFFLAGACLCFCGAAARYKDDITGTIHGVGAIGGITLALIGLLTQGVIFPLIGVIVSTVVLKQFKFDNATWWIEIISFVLIYTGLIVAL